MKDNLYVIRASNNKGESLVKLGYSSSINRRLDQYISHNPFTEVLSTHFRNDALEFEQAFHKSNRSIVKNEWYKEELLIDIYKALSDLEYSKINLPTFKELVEQYNIDGTFLKGANLDHIKVIEDSIENFGEIGTDLYHAKLKIKNEIPTTLIHEIKLLCKDRFKSNNKYSRKEVKRELKLIYKELNIVKSITSNVIQEYISCTPYRTSKERGYFIC